MNIADFIRNDVFLPRLRKASVLAVYDPDRRYRGICQSMARDDTAVVDASEGSIEAREVAMLALASLGKSNSRKELLVYVPAKPPVTDEERQADPFAVYAACGAIFPSGDGDSYESICLKAKPDNTTEIRRLFAENKFPSFSLVDNIGGGLSLAVARTCLQSRNPLARSFWRFSCPARSKWRRSRQAGVGAGEQRPCWRSPLGSS